MRQSKFMKRMMVILLGAILVIVSAIQIAQNSGTLGINIALGILGLIEIGLSIAMMRVEAKKNKKSQ